MVVHRRLPAERGCCRSKILHNADANKKRIACIYQTQNFLFLPSTKRWQES